jgi:nitric oxide reductase subunit B
VEEFRRRELLVSKAWIQAVAVVILFGFFVLGLLAYRTYSGEAPIPARVVDPGKNVLFTRADIMSGQQVFLRNGLMEYGSIFGHGAYLGPDYTADYLRRSATSVFESHGGQKSDSANTQTVEEFKVNRYDPANDTLTFTPAQSAAHGQLKDYYQAIFSDPSTRSGLRPRAIGERRILRLVGLGCFGAPARHGLLVYE